MATKISAAGVIRASTHSSEEAALEHWRLLDVLRYDPETGVFVWRWTMSSRATAGSVAGSLDGKGYGRVNIDGKNYSLHRLAWFYVHGVWPTGVVDHRDRVKLNNRSLNLRDVTQSVNQWNRSATKGRDHLPMGVTFEARTGKYQARIVGLEGVGVQSSLGTYSTAELASTAYEAAKLIRELNEQSSR